MHGFRDIVLEAGRFGLVGVCATLTYLAISLIANGAGLPTYAASLLGYVSSVGVSYLGHALYTFRSDRPHRSTGPKFLVMTLSIFAVTNVIIFIVTDLLRYPFVIATLIVAGSIPLLTWLLSRHWVFGKSAKTS